MKLAKHTRKRAVKKVVSIVTSVVMLTSSLVLPEISEKIKDIFINASAAVDSGDLTGQWDISTLKGLYEFSELYHNSPATYQRKDVVLGINGNVVISPTMEIDGKTYTWYPIGTLARPFGGRLTININNGLTQNIQVDAPIFDYIMDSVEIVNSNDDNDVFPSQKLSLVRNSDVNYEDENEGNMPLFANHVVHDSAENSTPATWDLTASGTGSFSGIIGTVGRGSDITVVDIDLTISNSSGTVAAYSNAGLVCGTIKNGSTVSVEIKNETVPTITNITSKNGNAGGLVGEMEEGSTLNFYHGVYDVSSAGRSVSSKTYAGGLVGKNTLGTVVIKASKDDSEEPFNAQGTVSASEGAAGGIFGYYKINSTYDKFSPSNYTSTTGCTLGGKISGGLVGVLEADGIDVSYSGTETEENGETVVNRVSVVSTLSGSRTNYGGIIGSYSNTSLANSLTFEHTSVTMNGSQATNYGGAVGTLGGNSAVYVKIDDFTTTSTGSVGSCSYFGGAIGSAGDKGSMIDVGSITVTSSNAYKGGGVVGKLNAGVLRLSGITDLSGAAAASGGQIVGERTNGLVYALGSGNDTTAEYGRNWRLIRSSTDVAVDDIGTWGEVVRIADIEISTEEIPGVEADPDADPPVEEVEAVPASPAIVSFDPTSTNHTVTVSAAVINMRDARDFTKTALNMQLNDGNNLGALCFADINSSNRASLLSNRHLTISKSIDLSNTGITGFMRDGSLSSDDTEIKTFTGKLSKDTSGSGDVTIQLAVGERYGVLSDGTAVSDSNSTGRGAIFTHRFNGLFARTGDTAAVTDITIGGVMNIRSSVADMYVGGAIAYLKDCATLTSVNANETINYYYANVDKTTGQYVGGLIGMTECGAGKNVVVQGTSSTKATIAPTINVTGTCLNNDGVNFNQCIGGAIGFIKSVAGSLTNQTGTTFENITLSATVNALGAVASANVSVAGLIADIAWDTSDSAVDSDRDTRKITLTNIDVKKTVVKSPATSTTGGILGYRWFSTDVELRNVNLATDTVNNEINTPSKYIGGLVYKATGNWYVPATNGIVINSLDIKNGESTATPSGLGIIVHDGYYSTSGLFLEFCNKDSYSLASSGLTIPTMTGKIYDELVACLSNSASSLLKNNTSGIISYKTNGAYNMSNSRNSYNNKYNTTVVNKQSRYYYNADRNMSSGDGYKLLKWSLNRYAAVNLKRRFTNPFSNDVLSGTFDLKNVSYYPIDIEDDVTIGTSTFVFYNNDIESTETASDTKRKTRDGNSQHYLMHMGLFKDVSATITTTGNITMYGSVGVNDTYSGALINGTLTGTLETSPTKKIYLGFYDDEEYIAYPLKINNTDKYLLINKIGSDAVLDLNGLYIEGDAYYDEENECTNIYASSLIGDVQGSGISLNFSKLKIDSRSSEDVDIKETSKKPAYGTTKSIFKNATLLNKLDVDSTSVAIYNFSQSEDYNASGTHLANVTYGKELSSSVTYANEENKYYEDGENGNYIDPVTYPGAFTSGSDPENTAYDFSTDFLPYVRYYNKEVTGAPTATYTLREIKVNVVPSDLKDGCGTYDHPYEIENNKQMNSLALMLENADSTNKSDNIPNVRLPLSTAVGSASHWCKTDETTYSCHVYKYNSTLDQYEYRENEEATDPTDTWAAEDVRAYLAGAYYQTGSFTLDGNFHGLGGFDSRYAFKGVIIGKNNSTTITNKSGKPLIKISNGSVVKRLIIVVDNYDSTAEEHISVVTAGGVNTAFSYANNDLVYGGVIGKIMGGDNIIDKVSVTYNNSGYVQVEGTNDYLYCVGGYVGVIVNGGLIFRNMSTMETFKVNTESSATTSFASSTDNKHLYINPYIGRVINGYAIYETTSYSGDSVAITDENGNDVYKYYDASGKELTDVTDPENDDRVKTKVQQFKYDSASATYTLNNSTKNYQISNVNANSTNKITFGTFSETDAKNTIDIPDGQSLFILSLITQSGAGTASSANGDYAYAVSYDGTNPYWAYVNNTSTTCRIAAENTATHLASYDGVGTAVFADKTDETSDYYLSKSDTNSSTKAVPYIIYKYTAGSGTSYTARSITYPGNIFIMRLTTQNSNYNLPESFRGIGSICTLHGGLVGQSTRTNDEDGKYALELYGFEGNGATIDINLKFNAYGQGYDNYIKTVYGENYNSQSGGDHTGINVGFGLFNYFLQIKADGNTTGYNTTKGYYIGNFTLSGSVDVKEYKSDETQMDADTTDQNGVNRLRTRFAVGGVTSSILANDYVNLYQLKLKDFNVSGTSMVGGYIGRCNNTGRDSDKGNGRMKVYVNNCNTENLKLTSRGGYCGGITAGYAMGFLDIYVNTAPDAGSTMNLSITNTTNCTESGTGGIVGSCRTGLNDIWINNVTVTGMTGYAYIKNGNTGDDDKQAVGGFIGYARKAGTIIITNSTVKNIDITGPCVGGFFGFIENTDKSPAWGQSPYIRIFNCKIENDDVGSNGDAVIHIIEGQKSAGGITGSFQTGKGTGSNLKYDTTGNNKGDTNVHGYDESADTTNTKYKYDIEGCEVSGYTIAQKKSTDTDYGVGGLIGYAAGTTRTIMNSSVHDCTIKIEGSSAKHYMGGVVGYTGNPISGYNISAYNNTFTYQDFSNQAATICGNLIGKTGNQVIKIAGFSRQNNYRQTAADAKTIVSPDAGTGSYGTNGYVIDADYTGVNRGTNHGTAMSGINSSSVTNVGEGAGKNFFPYATVSPYIGVGGSNILTGDGVALVNGSPLAKLIVNERKSNDAAGNDRIKYSNIIVGDGTSNDTTDAKLVSDMITWGEDTTSDHDIKLTTYFTEMGTPEGYEGDDFPIIAIGGSADYANYIKAYINVLTNSSSSYNTAGLGSGQDSNRYKIYIYPCRCIGGVFQKYSNNSSDCGLSYTKSGSVYTYTMNNNKADSIQPNNQISMIDICYCDPTATGSTAYHLYVPVLTKKMLKFDFSSTALQGTEYEPSVYEAKIPDTWGTNSKLGAGFDAWQTIYVQYDYSKAEVDQFLATGKGLNWNTTKSLNFNYNGDKSLALSTEFVLLDNNCNVDKEFYKTKSSSDTKTNSIGNKYDVIDFGDFTTARNKAAAIAETPFVPQTLKNIAGKKIVYTSDSSGAYVKCNKDQATVIAYSPDGSTEEYFKAGTSGERFTLNVKNIYEADSNGLYIECTETEAEIYAYNSNGEDRKFFKKGSGDTKYRINGDTITETYYLSMYTYSSDNTRTATTHDSYGFIVESPMTLPNTVITCQKNRSKNTEIYLGNFLKQSLGISEVNTDYKISTDNHVLKATLTSTIEFDGDSKTYFHTNLANEKLYQGFYLYLNRMDVRGNPTDDCSIKGTPSYTYTRTRDGEQYLSQVRGGVDDLAPYLYVDPIEITIPTYTLGSSWSSTQTAVIEMDFGSSEANLLKEFPIRTKTNGDWKGIGLDATAKLDFVSDRVPYSNNIQEAGENKPTKTYYIDRTGQSGVLTLTALDQSTNDEYDTYGEQSKNRNALGVNGKYISEGSKYKGRTINNGYLEHIDVGFDYDITNLPDEVFTDGDYDLDLTIVLEQKNDKNSSPGYDYTPVNIEDLTGTTNTGYLDNFVFYDKNDNELGLTNNRYNTTGYLYKTYHMDLTTNTSDWSIKYTNSGGQKHLTSNIAFDVKTDDLLEDITGYLYANYRLKVTATISKGSTTYTSEDYIVYTNAKVNAEFVTAAS